MSCVGMGYSSTMAGSPSDRWRLIDEGAKKVDGRNLDPRNRN
jgi:hypothetical protein